MNLEKVVSDHKRMVFWKVWSPVSEEDQENDSI
jgi:hypothetical protein